MHHEWSQPAGMVQESHSNCSFLLRKSNELSGFSGTSEKDKSIKTKIILLVKNKKHNHVQVYWFITICLNINF